MTFADRVKSNPVIGGILGGLIGVFLCAILSLVSTNMVVIFLCAAIPTGLLIGVLYAVISDQFKAALVASLVIFSAYVTWLAISPIRIALLQWAFWVTIIFSVPAMTALLVLVSRFPVALTAVWRGRSQRSSQHPLR